MKINVFNITLLACFVIVVAACNKNNKSAEEVAAKPVINQTIVAKVADASNVADAFNNYIELKNQFLKSNMKGIKSTAVMLENKLIGIIGCTEIATLAHQIATGNDIKAQREVFLILSKNIISLIKGTKFKSVPIYVDFCPMADNGKGGYWLSITKAIQNPYFPEHMKTCGVVKEQIN